MTDVDLVIGRFYAGDRVLYNTDVSRAIKAREHEESCEHQRAREQALHAPHRNTNGLG